LQTRSFLNGSQRKRAHSGAEAQGQEGMDFATTRGRTGFDGDAEAGIAGEGAQPSKNGHSL